MPISRAALADVDLNLLYTFRTFVEHGNVHRTAKALGRSQPAISARLHQLQREIGTDLLQRSGRRLELTPMGRMVAAELQSVFMDVQQMLDHLRASDREPSGLLRIGALPTVGVYVLTPKITEYRRRFPAVTVELRYGLVRELLEGLHAGQLDIIAAVGEPPGGALHVTVLGHTRPVLVVPKNRKPPLPRRRVGMHRLSELEWLGFGRIDDAFFDAVWEFLERHGLHQRVQVRVSNIQTLQALVAAGAGVTILPDYTVTDTRLATRRVEGLDISQPIWMASGRTRLDIPLIAKFQSLLGGRRV